MTTTTAVKYVPGASFACWQRSFDPAAGRPDGLSERPCGAAVVMHGYHWVQQVCPRCLTCYRVTARDEVVYMPGFFSGDTRRAVIDNITANLGRYVPTFER